MNGIDERRFKRVENNIIGKYDLIYDSTIISYMVDFEKSILQINTRNCDKEIIIRFKGLLAHKFENVITNNIIFDISEATMEEFILEESNTLSESLEYGFPTIEVSNMRELENYLKENLYGVFYITSSLGMCGYIIAKEIIL